MNVVACGSSAVASRAFQPTARTQRQGWVSTDGSCVCSGAVTGAGASGWTWSRAQHHRGGRSCLPSTVCRAVYDPPHPGETPEQARLRRIRESVEVESHVAQIYNEKDLERELRNAGNKLVVLEVQSENVCETGLDEPEPEQHWKLDKQKWEEEQMMKCVQIKHVFQRTARDCPDVKFLALEAEGDEANALCDKLEVEVLPTVQFYRHGRKLWQFAGTSNMEGGAALGEGVLYYGNAMANGASAGQFVADVTSHEQLRELTSSVDNDTLVVLNVSLSDALGCIKVYPAVVALAKSFAGFATFGRLLGDASPEAFQLLRELNVVEVPSFIYFRGGKEVGRHVGSSRGDLIGQILQLQAAAGISPPPPPKNAPKRTAWKRKGAKARA